MHWDGAVSGCNSGWLGNLWFPDPWAELNPGLLLTIENLMVSQPGTTAGLIRRETQSRMCYRETGPWATCPQCVAEKSLCYSQGWQVPFHLKIVHYLSGDLLKTGFLLGKVVLDYNILWVGADWKQSSRKREKTLPYYLGLDLLHYKGPLAAVVLWPD